MQMCGGIAACGVDVVVVQLRAILYCRATKSCTLLKCGTPMLTCCMPPSCVRSRCEAAEPTACGVCGYSGGGACHSCHSIAHSTTPRQLLKPVSTLRPTNTSDPSCHSSGHAFHHAGQCLNTQEHELGCETPAATAVGTHFTKPRQLLITNQKQ
jgi:hypothetical protein